MAVIRQRTKADLEGCVEVIRHVYAACRYPVQGTDRAEEFLDYPELREAWVAEDDGYIVGNIAVATPSGSDISAMLWQELHPGAPAATLERLFVHPEYQGRGIAKQLMLAATRWSQDAGVRLLLYALVKDQRAIGMYRKLGWEEFGTRDYRYGAGKSMAAICFSSPTNAEPPSRIGSS